MGKLPGHLSKANKARREAAKKRKAAARAESTSGPQYANQVAAQPNSVADAVKPAKKTKKNSVGSRGKDTKPRKSRAFALDSTLLQNSPALSSKRTRTNRTAASTFTPANKTDIEKWPKGGPKVPDRSHIDYYRHHFTNKEKLSSRIDAMTEKLSACDAAFITRLGQLHATGTGVSEKDAEEMAVDIQLMDGMAEEIDHQDKQIKALEAQLAVAKTELEKRGYVTCHVPVFVCFCLSV